MIPEVDLLTVDRGSVTAPAGCGKTHVIASALSRHVGPKPILVLTHTNAGVAALRQRLLKAGVKPSAYKLTTLDGWAMRLIRTFPMRSGHRPAILEVRNPSRDYVAIRQSAAVLLQSGHLTDVLHASYDRLLVDEYQDCSDLQHVIVSIASDTLRACVLGDPLQAIFGFAGNKLVDWEGDVCSHFPHVARLATPWRWINVGERTFGDWLLEVRDRLLKGQPIDLRTAPSNVTWIKLDGSDDRSKRLAACRSMAPSTGGGVLIIGDSRDPPGQRQIASDTPGAMTVEGVELKDLVDFSIRFDPMQPNALAQIGQFADLVMSGADGNGLSGRARMLQTHPPALPSDVERAAMAFMSAPSYRGTVDVLVELGKQNGVRPHRPSVLSCCVKALNASVDSKPGAFVEAAIRAREDNRVLGRAIPSRAVGSTLLLKGLEADVSVVLDAEKMDPSHLYVAMTRGSRKLVICSRRPVLAG